MASSYAMALQQLLQKLQQTNLGLDDQTQQITSSTQRGLYDASLEKDKSIQSTNESAADRGMVNSGINIAQGADVRSRYDTLMSRLRGDESNALGSIARQRLQAESEHSAGKQNVALQEQEDIAAAAAVEAQRKADEQTKLAETNPSAAGISLGATYNSPEEYNAAALAYQAAEYQNSVNAYMAATAPPPPTPIRRPAAPRAVTPRAPLRPIRGPY